MSPSFLLRARWQMWCSTSTSVIVRSGQPAAAMQRTAQRENAFQATMSPNSNSESSTLRGDTRCDDETMPRVGARAPSWRRRADAEAPPAVAVAVSAGVPLAEPGAALEGTSFQQNIGNLSAFYRNRGGAARVKEPMRG